MRYTNHASSGAHHGNLKRTIRNKNLAQWLYF